MRKLLMTLSLVPFAACSGGSDSSHGHSHNSAGQEKSAGPAEPAKQPAAAPAKAVEPAPAAPAKAAEPAAPAVAVPEGATAVVINGNDAMQFDKAEIRVKAGAKVALTLKHTGKMPKTAMGHNLVILAAGTDLTAFTTAAVAAAAEDYVPKSQAASIIAATKLLGGGESDTIIFDAPAVGSYDYICSFPGHYAIMKGKLIVE